MKAADATISYLELLKLASPETIVVITALAVLAVGLGTGRVRSTTTVSTVQRARSASNSATAMRICSAVAGLGLAIAGVVVLQLPQGTTLFGGMLVITPFTSLFKIICIVLAFFTVLLIASQKSTPHPGEYLALVLFATVGLMLLVGSEEFQRFHTFWDQSDLWHDWHYQSSSNFAETGQRIPDIVGIAGCWDHYDARRLRVQNRRRAVSPLGA